MNIRSNEARFKVSRILGLLVGSALSASIAMAQPVVAPVATADQIAQVQQDYNKAGGAAADAKMLEVTTKSGDTPSVPASVMRGVGIEKPVSAAAMSYQDIVVTPGVNTIVPAALGHQNRIVTPFEDPEIHSVTEADIQVQQNVVYVAPQDEKPVTMYINPKGDQSVAISLTLAPQKIPPVQATLTVKSPSAGKAAGGVVAGGDADSRRYTGSARKWEQTQPYMDTVRLIMRSLALGKMPTGYTMTSITVQTKVPVCQQDGLSTSFSRGQWLQGHNFNVFIGVAKNTTNEPVIFDEGKCSHPNLAAVAVWPNNMLEAGEKTEMYVITRIPPAQTVTTERPSLLGAGQ